ncbi:MAG: S41 family peptidase [Planctomycetota bacterium]
MLRMGTWLGLLSGLLIGLSVGSALARPQETGGIGDRREFFERVGWLVAQVQEHSVEEADHDKLLVGAYEGILSKLDKYSVYWPADMLKEFEAELEGQFGGLGISISFDPIKKAVLIKRPIPGTPAAKAELLEGDLIVEILEKSTGVVTKTEEFKSVHDAVRVLRGKPGTKVVITVIHGGDGKREKITITREIINIPGVRAVEIIEPERRIGYIYIPYFSKPMVEDLEAAIDELRAEGARGLVLDLRLNPGGLLKAAEDCADLFLPPDKDIVHVRGRSVEGRPSVEETHTTRRRTDYGEMALVLLVNRFSASGAEIVAAALRDHGRAVVVGESTFGKASVQTLIGNPYDDSAIKLTIAHYYTPKDQLIEGEGIKPDIEVALSEENLRKLARHLGEKTEYPPPPPGEAAQKEQAPEEEEAGSAKDPKGEEHADFRDVQLERAVEVLAGILAEESAPDQTRHAVAVPSG